MKPSSIIFILVSLFLGLAAGVEHPNYLPLAKENKASALLSSSASAAAASSASSLSSPGLALLSRLSNLFVGKVATAPSPTKPLPLATATTTDMPTDGMIHQTPTKTPPPGTTPDMATDAMSAQQPRSSGPSSSFANFFRRVIARILRVSPDDLTLEVSWHRAADKATITPSPELTPTKTLPLTFDTPSDGVSERTTTEDDQRRLEALLDIVLLLIIVLAAAMVSLVAATVVFLFFRRAPGNDRGESVLSPSLDQQMVETISTDCAGTQTDFAAEDGKVSWHPQDAETQTVGGSEVTPDSPTIATGPGPVLADEPQHPPSIGQETDLDPETSCKATPASPPPPAATSRASSPELKLDLTRTQVRRLLRKREKARKREEEEGREVDAAAAGSSQQGGMEVGRGGMMGRSRWAP